MRLANQSFCRPSNIASFYGTRGLDDALLYDTIWLIAYALIHVIIQQLSFIHSRHRLILNFQGCSFLPAVYASLRRHLRDWY